MTALEMLKELKKNERAILWLNSDRKEACFHDGNHACPVKYNDARLVRTDPAIYIIDKTDGETLSA